MTICGGLRERAEEDCTKDKLWTRGGAVHSNGGLGSGPPASVCEDRDRHRGQSDYDHPRDRPHRKMLKIVTEDVLVKPKPAVFRMSLDNQPAGPETEVSARCPPCGKTDDRREAKR